MTFNLCSRQGTVQPYTITLMGLGFFLKLKKLEQPHRYRDKVSLVVERLENTRSHSEHGRKDSSQRQYSDREVPER